MSDIKEKIDMELKPYDSLCEDTTQHLKMLISGSTEADPNTILSVTKTLGEIVDVKKDIVEMCYKKKILEAMEDHEGEYGESWDEEGPMSKRYYRGQARDSRGRYMSRNYSDPLMHMPDMNTGDYIRMYYGGDQGSNQSYGSSRDYREGTSGLSRKGYMESKEMHRGNSSEDMKTKMKDLEKYTKDLSDDIMEMIEDASQEEKVMMKQKLQVLAQKIQ